MRRFWHVGINVTDLDRSIAFYRLVGFRLLEEKQVDDPQLGQAFMVGDGTRLRFAHMKLGEGEHEAMLDIIEWLEPPARGRAEPSLVAPGLCRFSILCDDAMAEYERLGPQGVEFLQPPHTVLGPDGEHGWRLLFARDPDGTIFHFVELVGARAEGAHG